MFLKIIRRCYNHAVIVHAAVAYYLKYFFQIQENGHVTRNISGYNIFPESYISETNSVEIIFHSDVSRTGRGFQLSYKRKHIMAHYNLEM